LRLGIEAEAGEDGRGTRRGAVGADGDEAFVDFAHAVAVGVALGLGQQGGALGIGGQHGFQQAFRPGGGFLRHMAHAGALGQADLAAIRLDLAGDGLQQGGLAGAVAADQADLAAGVHHEVGAFQKGAAGDAEGEVADGEDGHGRPT
jgi:hypothetical protein